jgi:hypothetical protein
VEQLTEREEFVAANAAVLVAQLERKVARQRRELARLNRRLEAYAVLKQALNAARLQNEALVEELGRDRRLP